MSKLPLGGFEAAAEFRSTLTPETDRGCALMAAAYLDTRLAELLRAYFVNDAKIADNILEQSKPLGTFSSRIDTAYLLGLISRSGHRALHAIRKIRNEFSHVDKPISFKEAKISDYCKQLEALSPLKRTDQRSMFTGAVMLVLATIDVHPKIEHRKPRPDVGLGRDVPGLEAKGARMQEAFLRYLLAPPSERKRALLECESAAAEFLGGRHVIRKAYARRIAARLRKMLQSVESE